MGSGVIIVTSGTTRPGPIPFMWILYAPVYVPRERLTRLFGEVIAVSVVSIVPSYTSPTTRKSTSGIIGLPLSSMASVTLTVTTFPTWLEVIV